MATRLQLLKPKFRLATFDITNTLLKFNKSVGNAYSDVGAIYGAICEPQKLDAAFRTHWNWMRQMYPNYGKHSGMSTKTWWSELVRRTFYETQSSISKEQLTAISNDLYDRYSTGECWNVYNGVHEQLDALKNNHFILGVISNFDERLELVMDATGIRKYFHFVLASYFVGCEKPDNKIFDIALQKAGNHANIKACEAVHIGDNFSLDYMGAKKAGWNALLFHPENRKSLDKTMVYDQGEIIKDIKDIQKYLFI